MGIPTVLDRFIQQAMMQALQRSWDGTFSEHSYGFRPKRSAHQAVEQAQRYQAEGYRWVVDLDLEKSFDRVNHDRLLAKIAERVSDKRLLRLIRAFLRAGVMENGLVSPAEEGTPQGGPVSPVLSNIVLNELDQELERRGHRFTRYADDCNIYVRSRRAGEPVMRSVTLLLTTKLKLRVNSEKSAVARPWERKFLGFSFTNHKQPKRRLAPKAVARFKERVRELTWRTRGISLVRMVHDLRNISADGLVTSDAAKPRKCSTSWSNGCDVDFGRWSGSSGNGEPGDIGSSASAASLRRRPRKPRVARMDRGTLPRLQR